MTLISNPTSLARLGRGRSTDRAVESPVQLETVACLNCGGRSHDVVLAAPDVMTPSRRFQIVRCQACQLAFTNPRPIVECIGQFYPPEYECHDMQGNWDVRWRARWRRKLTRSVLRVSYGYPPQPADLTTRLQAWIGRTWIRRSSYRCEWIPFTEPGRLLDFGCGAGAFLRRMRDLGWSVEGVDASSAAARAVTAETGISVHVGSLPHVALCGRQFELVTMWASLEHVHDPRRIVREARNLLRPGGRLVVAVPNFESWSRRAFGEQWYGIQVPRHLTHFTPATLAMLLATEGFRVERIDQVAMDGWIRRSARDVGSSPAHPRWLRRLRWKPLACAVAAWTERVGHGDNIVAVATRA